MNVKEVRYCLKHRDPVYFNLEIVFVGSAHDCLSYAERMNWTKFLIEPYRAPHNYNEASK